MKTATREQKHKKGKAPREKQKLSYKETGESGALPLKIEALEEEKQRLLETLNSPAFYVNRDTDEIMQSKSKAWTWPRTLNWSMA